MPSYMEDYINSFVALATKHCSCLSIKHWFLSQRSRFDSRRGIHPWTFFWCSATVLVKEYRCWLCLDMGLAYRSKQLVFASLEENLRQGRRVEVWRRRGTNNLFGQKLFLLQLDDQTNYLFIQMQLPGFYKNVKTDWGILWERIQPNLP